MQPRGRVGLFVTCPVDLFRPAVGFAAARLLEEAGYAVEAPPQSCCGQVGYNNGSPGSTRQLAWQLVEAFEDFDYTVLPSGSCGAMIRDHYPRLFRGDSRLPRVEAFCARVYELTNFLVEVADFHLPPRSPTGIQGAVTYHDSCAGLREMGIRTQPRALLQQAGIEVAEMPGTDVCCGFGGTFCVKFPDISSHMADEKLDNAAAVDAGLLLGGDLSCLLHLAGRAWRRGLPLQCRHVAEVLAGELDESAIGQADGGSVGEAASGTPGEAAD